MFLFCCIRVTSNPQKKNCSITLDPRVRMNCSKIPSWPVTWYTWSVSKKYTLVLLSHWDFGIVDYWRTASPKLSDIHLYILKLSKRHLNHSVTDHLNVGLFWGSNILNGNLIRSKTPSPSWIFTLSLQCHLWHSNQTC